MRGLIALLLTGAACTVVALAAMCQVSPATSGNAAVCDFVCISTGAQHHCEWVCEQPQLEVDCTDCQYICQNSRCAFNCNMCSVSRIED